MGSIVYLNGEFVAPENAKVSIFDFGYLFGDGIFETLRAYDGHVFRLDEHVDRFFRAARYVLIDPPVGRADLAKLCHEALERSGNRDAYLRITMSRGVGTRGIDPASCGEPTLSIVAREYTPYPAECYRDGIQTKIVSVRRVADDALSPRIKGNNYQNHILAKIELNQCGLREGFLLNSRGFVAEGTISNVFVVRRGRLSTPSLACGCLEGITRNAVLEVARDELEMPALETELTPFDLHTADECFVTNTLMEILPVVNVDGRSIGDGRPGAATLDLHRRYQALVVREAAS
jgi:branched-chain amino acid aminotransferase